MAPTTTGGGDIPKHSYKHAHQEIDLYSNSEYFILEPKNCHPNQTIGINRNTGEYLTSNVDKNAFPGLQSKGTIHGLLGSITLLAGPYLVVISQKSLVAKLGQHNIYKIKKVELLPYRTPTLTDAQRADEQEYTSMITEVLNCGAFYFSYSFDLTCSIQENYTKERNSLWREADKIFFWNYYLSRDLIAQELDGYIIPTIRGFVEIGECNINNKPMVFGLISRGSCKRAGTRYNMRGVDEEGHVANFAETEQIIVVDGTIVSFLQIRGSIPVYWNQYANLKYKPKPALENRGTSEAQAGFKAHFNMTLKRYKKIVAVNLVDQKGSEKLLADQFHNYVKDLGSEHVKYVAFDFHKECKKMRYDKIDNLLDMIAADITAHGYCVVNQRGGKVQRLQTGVIRNNCIDCLDRTNVVQSAIARAVLTKQLIELGVIPQGSTLQSYESFNHIFRNYWADNADALSTLYSGTGALKTDFTRTGTRGWRGMIADGANSLIRYYLQNFKDGRRQDAVNLFLGHYRVDPLAPSPFAESKANNKLYNVLKLGLVVGLIMALANILLLFNSDSSNFMSRMVFVFAWSAFLYVIYKVLMLNGRQYVDNPVLVYKKKLV